MSGLSNFFSNAAKNVIPVAADIVSPVPGTGAALSGYFSGTNRNLPNGGGSYQSVAPAQTTAQPDAIPASTAVNSFPSGGDQNTPQSDTSGGGSAPSNGQITPEDYAYAANAITKAMGSQGDSATISGELTGLNNTANDLSVGNTNLFANQEAGLPLTADQIAATQKAQGGIYAPGVAALSTKLGQAEESDVYSNKFQGPLTTNSFTPDELTALNNVAAGNSSYAGSPAYISATAKIQEAQKRGLDAQRFGYTQSIYGIGGGTPVDTTSLPPVTTPVGSASFKGQGADGSTSNSNFGVPAYYDAEGNPLDANGNPWPTNNNYGNIPAQTKLSSDYVTALQKADSSKSGDLGIQNGKVSSAIHAMALINQNTDANGNINLSSSQYQELAQSAAALISGSSGGTDSQINGLIQPTLQGTTNSILSYISGDPLNAATQANLKRLSETIVRQGETAEGLRDAALDNQAIVPAGMDPARAKYDKAQANFPSFTSYINGSGIGSNPYSGSSSGGSSGGSSSGIDNGFSTYLGGSTQ